MVGQSPFQSGSTEFSNLDSGRSKEAQKETDQMRHRTQSKEGGPELTICLWLKLTTQNPKLNGGRSWDVPLCSVLAKLLVKSNPSLIELKK